MKYTSILQTLEAFSNAVAMCSDHRVGASTILYPTVEVRGSWELLMVVNKAPCSLLTNSQACHIDGINEYSRDP